MENSDHHSRNTIDDCQTITFDKHSHENGNLSVVENGRGLPFRIKRVFYIYDVPGGTNRGGHSHRNCHELIVAASGSFDLTVNDGLRSRTVTLNRSNIGFHMVPGIWVELRNFSSGSVCLSICSDEFDPDDYVHSYDEFIQLTAAKRQ